MDKCTTGDTKANTRKVVKSGSFRLFINENVQDLDKKIQRLRKFSDNIDSYLIEPETRKLLKTETTQLLKKKG